MSSKGETDEAPRGSEASTSGNNSAPSVSEAPIPPACEADDPRDVMKRAAAKQLIERYFYQLVDGCGDPHCDNQHCASSSESRSLSPNEAAAEAIKLFYKEARLCDGQPSKLRRTERDQPHACFSLPCATSGEVTSSGADGSPPSHTVLDTSQKISQPDDFGTLSHNNGAPLTEERMSWLCAECVRTRTAQPLIRALGEAFTQPALLARCFPAQRGAGGSRDGATGSCSSDPDKDEDCAGRPPPDLDSCQRAFQHLAKVPAEYYSSALVTSLTVLAETLALDLRAARSLRLEDAVTCLALVFELPRLDEQEYLDVALPALCRAAEHLPVQGQARLARVWAARGASHLWRLLGTLQQHVTLRVVSADYSALQPVQQDPVVSSAVKLMKIVYYASVVGGSVEAAGREAPVLLPRQADPLGDALDSWLPRACKRAADPAAPDPLALELGVDVLDARKPLVPFEEFYNEVLSDAVEMDKDFANYKTELSNGKKFSLMRYPFVLTVARKSLGLYYENRIRMYSERRASLLQACVGAAPPQPFLRLRVRRASLIADALVELEMVAMERALDLKKQLVVEFEGEQGVDEGGVSKEFFQLVVDQLFHPDYGMFTHQHDTHTVWFNPTSFETEAQFTLAGIVLGLAIYNHVILAVEFPMAVYRKLMGKKGSFEDLADWNPVLYSGLKDMLEYPGEDLEQVYLQTFRIGYSDVFGAALTHDLKDDGENIAVTQDNKREFVDLYADFLLNSSVAAQFGAFRRGFVMVTDESSLPALFRPEELELLVCGSKNFDFKELESSTEYDGGYTATSQTIVDFWDIVHELSAADKRRLLQFATGSDRVPVGGMSHLKLVVARNGPDCDRLPTAHTCFNVLLLPEYDTKDKLRDRLLKAISYSKGFGML